MKNLLIFLFGAICGAGGTILYLRKDIKKELEQIKNDSELPFEMGENEEKKTENESSEEKKEPVELTSERPEVAAEKVKVAYHKVIKAVAETPKSGNSEQISVPILPREEDENELEIKNLTAVPNVCFEIDKDDFCNEHDGKEQEYLIYYSGDRIMCTENGTIITNPAILVGTQWEQYIGHYANHTAFVENARANTKYEIFVEYKCYKDDYGDYDIERED